MPSQVVLHWIYPALIASIFFGAGNTLAHAKRKQGKEDKPLVRHTYLGIATGVCIGIIEHALGLIPIAGKTLQLLYIAYAILHVFIGILGLSAGALNHGMKGIRQAFYIFIGLFYLDENSSFRSVIHGLLRHTWEMPQTFIGHAYSQIRNIFSNVSRVEYFGGSTFVINERQMFQDGISLSNYLNINLWASIQYDFNHSIKHHPILLHEYGHTIDSRRFGWLYMIVIGIPSLKSAIGKGDHSVFWTEKRANRNAKNYLAKYENISWNDYESEYPTT